MLLKKWCPLCNLRARDPHQLLLNTSHFFATFACELTSPILRSWEYVVVSSYNYREKVKFLPPISCVSTRFDVSRSALEQKKLYIPLPCAMYLCCNIYVPTYLSFDSSCTMGPNRVWNCILIKTLMISCDIFLLWTFITLGKSKKIVRLEIWFFWITSKVVWTHCGAL